MKFHIAQVFLIFQTYSKMVLLGILPDMLLFVFVFQGSDSLASWQANLFFEPTKFEVKNI